MTQPERREHAVHILTASMLYRLLTDEGNAAAGLLLEDVMAASLAQHIRAMNEEYARGTLVPLVLFPKGSTRGMKILGSLV